MDGWMDGWIDSMFVAFFIAVTLVAVDYSFCSLPSTLKNLNSMIYKCNTKPKRNCTFSIHDCSHISVLSLYLSLLQTSAF